MRMTRSVIFLFNVLAAIIVPYLSQVLGFSTVSGDAFGLFAGTAVNATARAATLSKVLMILAMASIGLNTDLVKLIKTGDTHILMGTCCWISMILAMISPLSQPIFHL